MTADTDIEQHRQAFSDMSDEELQEAIRRRRALDLDLRNRRSTGGTLDDTLRGLDALIMDAQEILERGWEQQTYQLEQVGRNDVAGWDLPSHFAEAWVILQDHGGEQRLTQAILARSYGMTFEEYELQHAAGLKAIAKMELELIERENRRDQAAQEAKRAEQLGRIEGR